MLNKKDINKYNTSSSRVPTPAAEDEFAVSAGATAKTLGSMVWKAFITVFTILVVAGCIVLVSVASFIWSLRDTEIAALTDYKLDYTSHVYSDNGDGTFAEYMAFHSTENRVWVNFADIPQHMLDAMVAIEDKRFYEHHGVDWTTTLGAVYNLATGNGGGGGSTLTQQLIKNVTGQNDVSILRKVTEIFSALNLEKEYTKDQILEYYLNVVSFGSGTKGVQAAANLYFGKDIKDCSIAECASIAGITQNPYQFTPIIFPEDNRDRQLVVLSEMYAQGYITKAEYDEALAESNNMKWAFNETSQTGTTEEVKEDVLDSTESVWNWYIEAMRDEIIHTVSEEKNVSEDYVSTLIDTGGLQIYSCLRPKLQEGIDNIMLNAGEITDDEQILFGSYIMDYTGKVLAVGGSRYEKTGNLTRSCATDVTRQAGSSFKPISVYSTAFDMGKITYGTVLKDQPLEGYFDNGESGPNNVYGGFTDWMNVDRAIEQSQNAPAAQLCDEITPSACYNFLTERLHFTTLDPEHDQRVSSMAIGGQHNGVTVKEMTSAFQIFGNGGNYFEPYTFYYILDHDGNPVIDRRDQIPTKVLSEENATIMNRLLQNVIYGDYGTGYQAILDGDWRMFGKTGTTDDEYDVWFVGGVPFAVAGVWAGYEYADRLSDKLAAKHMWKAIMQFVVDNYGEGQPTDYNYSENVEQRTFCRSSGLLANTGCYNTATGWYDVNNLPSYCNGGSDHSKYGKTTNATPAPTAAPSLAPTPTPSATPEPSVTPAPTEAPGTPEPVTPQPPVTTPQPPVTTPEPPVITPEPPVTTPEPPVTTPEPPITTPEPPVTTPEPPAATPEPPVA